MTDAPPVGVAIRAAPVAAFTAAPTATTAVTTTFLDCVLTLGDISIDIVDHEDVAKCALLIERKTIPDLLSSIKDGRYKEQ